MNTVDDLLERVRATGLLPTGSPVVVLLSGGRDSVCLLDMAVRLSGPGAVSALHADYGLREGSADDAAHCGALCKELGVELVVERARRPDAAGNLQAWARDVRLAAGARVAAKRGARMATGHTATDQAETVLYRLAASPGRRALLGMADSEGSAVRPLLTLTREETGVYCEARELAWREDPTNASGNFARNRARARLVPALRELHPSAEANVIRTAQLLRDEAAVLDEVVDTALGGRDEIAIDRLEALPPALARLVLRRLAEDATGVLCARSADRVADVFAVGDGALDLGDGARAVVTGGVLRVQRTPPGRSAPGRSAAPVSLSPGDRTRASPR